jgi:RNA polymerase sigma factor (sigma-70 family)
LAHAQPFRRRGRRSGIHDARLQILSRVSRRRRTRLDLQIVRNTCYTWLEKNRPVEAATEFDEELHTQPGPNPEALAIAGDNRERLSRALEELPARFREVLVLRELEGCSYKEIATITSMPIGTVMSALSRARGRLQQVLTQQHSASRQAATS